MTETTRKSSRRAISYGKTEIPFDLAIREVQRLTINVHPDKSVSVVAPIGKPIEEILERVRKRAPWIVKQQDHFDKFHPFPSDRKFVSGETHYYLGRQYRLKVTQGKIESAKLKGKFLVVQVVDRENPDQVKNLVDAWYRRQASRIFEQVLCVSLEKSKSLRIEKPKLTIRHMLRRWGSCTKAGNVILNIDLIKTPKHCIEYVVMHELCHLRVPNHNKEFYQLLSKYMVDWERRKEKLNGYLA
jgi:hypothetical protein